MFPLQCLGLSLEGGSSCQLKKRVCPIAVVDRSGWSVGPCARRSCFLLLWPSHRVHAQIPRRHPSLPRKFPLMSAFHRDSREIRLHFLTTTRGKASSHWCGPVRVAIVAHQTQRRPLAIQDRECLRPTNPCQNCSTT